MFLTPLSPYGNSSICPKLEGDLIQDRGHIVDIDVGFFSLPIPVAVVPTVAVIANALVKNPSLDTMTGPYNSGNPDTQEVKTRKICHVPHLLTGLWLLDEDGIPWEILFETIYPAIVNEENEAS